MSENANRGGGGSRPSGGGGRSGGRPGGRPGGNRGRGGRRFFRRPRVCQFCADKSIQFDYKKVSMLSGFVNQEGKIRPRRQTGTCAKHQRQVAITVKRSRHMALMSYTGESLN